MCKKDLFARFSKGISVVLSLALCTAVSACGSPVASNDAAESDTVSPIAVEAEKETGEKTIYKVGITQFAAHPSLDNCREGFIEGMKQGGYIEGENVEFDFQNAQTENAQAVTIANKFVSDNVDLICAIATPSAVATAAAVEGHDIPLVFNAVSEPAEAGLTDESGAPHGNITGVSDKLPSEQQVALIQALLPDAKTVGILYCSSEASSEAQATQFKAYAESVGLGVEIVTVASSNDISSALDTLLPQVDCIQNLLDNTIVAALPLVLEKAHAAGKPVFGSEEEQVVNGCAASEGVNYIELGIQCGLQAAKILDGTPVSDVPIEEVAQSSLSINLESLAELNIEAPQELLDRAALVVEETK